MKFVTHTRRNSWSSRVFWVTLLCVLYTWDKLQAIAWFPTVCAFKQGCIQGSVHKDRGPGCILCGTIIASSTLYGHRHEDKFGSPCTSHVCRLSMLRYVCVLNTQSWVSDILYTSRSVTWWNATSSTKSGALELWLSHHMWSNADIGIRHRFSTVETSAAVCSRRTQTCKRTLQEECPRWVRSFDFQISNPWSNQCRNTFWQGGLLQSCMNALGVCRSSAATTKTLSQCIATERMCSPREVHNPFPPTTAPMLNVSSRRGQSIYLFDWQHHQYPHGQGM